MRPPAVADEVKHTFHLDEAMQPFANRNFYRHLFIVFMLLFAASPSWGLGKELQTASTRVVPAPAYLYHWTSWQSLERWDKDIEAANGATTLKMIEKSMNASNSFPELTNRAGLYAWTNPVGGIGVSWHEINGNGEALVQLEIDPAARAKVVRTEKSFENSDEPRNISGLDGIDLLLSKEYDKGRLVLQEWIILNPKVIKSRTADPEHLKPILEMELVRLEKESFSYGPRALYSLGRDGLHWLNFAREHVAVLVNTFLLSRNKVPKSFLSGKPGTCKLARQLLAVDPVSAIGANN